MNNRTGELTSYDCLDVMQSGGGKKIDVVTVLKERMKGKCFVRLLMHVNTSSM